MIRLLISFVILSLFFVVLTKKTTAQPYIIPGATQQPTWVFPLFFENALGEKDTLYLGYDSAAYNPVQPGLSGDSVFGEKLIKVDTSKFNMSFCSYIINNDSLVKTMISYTLNNTGICGDGFFEIYSIHGLLPIKMSWDVSLFRSDSLPFFDQNPLPRAQGLLYFQGDASDGFNYCMSPGDPLLITDTALGGGFEICVRKDSVVFTQLLYLALRINPWSGRILSVSKVKSSNLLIQIYPNPFSYSTTINIINNEKEIIDYKLEIYDMLGNLVYNSVVNQQKYEINRGNLLDGIYFYQLRNINGEIYSGKLIIQ